KKAHHRPQRHAQNKHSLPDMTPNDTVAGSAPLCSVRDDQPLRLEREMIELSFRDAISAKWLLR
ncbi:hypothetical protein, partial [Bosea lathyri]|uniref:hypothetical protein n=1 Tax=Bosea lathyri TaxID=1036778 RepID=UPI001AECF9DE